MNKNNKKNFKLLFFIFFGIIVLMFYLTWANKNIPQPYKYEIDKKL
tara:strand:+ start:1779 stop:1916 length:138 start_codon:yes stop_codon:yes gene_type:complete